MLFAALALLAVQSSVIKDDAELPPASEAAILAGVKACVGATVDPAGQDARLAGWPSVVGNDPDKDTGKDGGGVAKRVASKDNVRLVVKTGLDGGCVVQAQGDGSFGRDKLLADVGAQAGVTVDGTKPVVTLPNGEIMVIQVGGEKGKLFAQFVVANPNGKYAKQSKGN